VLQRLHIGNPKEKLVKIPVPEFVLMTGLSIYGIYHVFGDNKEYNRYNLYNSTKKRFLFFLTNLLFVRSFTYETIQLENK